MIIKKMLTRFPTNISKKFVLLSPVLVILSLNFVNPELWEEKEEEQLVMLDATYRPQTGDVKVEVSDQSYPPSKLQGKIYYHFYRSIVTHGTTELISENSGFFDINAEPGIWYEYVLVKNRIRPRYMKITLPDSYKIANKRQLEAKSGFKLTAENEVIIKIQIPGIHLEILSTGKMYASANPYIAFYFLFGFLWKKRKQSKLQRYFSWLAKEDKTERELIAEGLLKEALKQFFIRMKSRNENAEKEIILLKARLADLLKRRMLGLLNDQSYTVERNRITKDTLDLLSEVA